MASIQHSIEVNVPLHAAYQQLARFEEYPRFMNGVREVRRLDEERLHWQAHIGDRDVQWDALITKQVPDECIAWRSISGPPRAGSLELRATGAARTKVTWTVESAPQEDAVPGEDMEAVLGRRAEEDLARFKKLMEGATDTTAAAAHEAAEEHRSGYSGEEGSDGQAVPVSSYAAGSEGWDGNEDPGVAVSVADPVAPETGERAGQAAANEDGQRPATTQSEASLSRSMGGGQDEGVFRVAEEQSFDQQSAQARRVGQMPPDQPGMGSQQNPADAMKESLRADPSPGATARPGSARHEAGRRPASDTNPGEASWVPNFLQSREEVLGVMRRVTGEMDQIFEKFVGRPIDEIRARRGMAARSTRGDAPPGSWAPVLEVAQRDNQLVVCAELPGVKLEDVRVEVRRDKLIIEGERHERTQQGGAYRRSERSYGHFYRAVPLPEGADPDAASAAMHDGVLEITMPVSATAVPGKRLDIRPS